MKLPDVLRAAPKPAKEKKPVVIDGLAPLENYRRMGWRDDEPFIAPWSEWHDPDSSG